MDTFMRTLGSWLQAITWLANEAQGRAKATAENKPVIVDFGATWCAACKELEHETFPHAGVRSEAKRFVTIRVDATDAQLDGALVARALATIVAQEKPDVVLLGKQAVDGDSNQVAQQLAELLGWPQATFAATIQEEAGALLVGREVDGGVITLRVKLPAVVSVDLRIVAPGVTSASMTQPGGSPSGEMRPWANRTTCRYSSACHPERSRRTSLSSRISRHSPEVSPSSSRPSQVAASPDGGVPPRT